MRSILPQQPLEDSVTHQIRWTKLLLVCSLVLALLLRLPWMSESLWYDEISATHAYLANIFHLLESWLFDTNMPVHYTIMFLWTKIFEDTEFSLRFVPLMFGLGSIFVAYELAKNIFNRNVALLTSFLLALSPVHIWYSTESRPYAGMVFFLLLAFLAFWKLEDSRKWLAVYAISVLLGTFSHFYMAVPVVVFSSLTLLRKDPFRWKVLTINAVTLILLVTFLYLKYRAANYFPTSAHYLRAFTPWEAWFLFFNWYSMGNTIWPIVPRLFSVGDLLKNPGMVLCQLFFLFLLIQGTRMILRESDQKKQFGGIAVIGFLVSTPLFLLFLNVVGRNHTYIERSAFIGLPFFFMVISGGLTSIRKRSLTILSGVALFLISLGGTIGLFQHAYVCPVGPCKQDWRSVAKYITTNISVPKEEVAVIQSLSPRSLPYYDSSFQNRVRLTRLHRNLPRILFLAESVLGKGSGAAAAIRREIEEVNVEYKSMRRGKIAILSFSELSKKQRSAYQTVFLCESPNFPSGAADMMNWLQGSPDFYLVEKRDFDAINIYKFQHR